MTASVNNATPPKGGAWSPQSGLYKSAAHSAHQMPPFGGMATSLYWKSQIVTSNLVSNEHLVG
jgi:hypothetical protein